MSVVVPFLGGEADAVRAAAALRRLRVGPGDELIVADNTGEAVAAPALGAIARVIAAHAERSSYHARNAGAALASADWLLFVDSDCVPAPDLLDAYFSEPIADDCGIVAGAIEGLDGRRSLLARYAHSRELYSGEIGLDGGGDGGAAPTGNLLVRRVAFEQARGFAEGIRSGGDVDLCWRVQSSGWTLVRRPQATVGHRHREDLRSFLSMLARYGASARWLNDRYPGASPRWPLSPLELARSVRDAARHALGGRREEAVFRLIDALGLIAHNVGYTRRNATASPPA